MAEITPRYTQADVDTLRANAFSGVLTVHFSGPPERTVTYQDITAMFEAAARMQAEVLRGTGQRQSYRLAAHRKGFDS